MRCCLCGEPFGTKEEPVIIERIEFSRYLQAGDRSQGTITNLRAHRACWHNFERNIQQAENAACEAMEARRLKSP